VRVQNAQVFCGAHYEGRSATGVATRVKTLEFCEVFLLHRRKPWEEMARTAISGQELVSLIEMVLAAVLRDAVAGGGNASVNGCRGRFSMPVRYARTDEAS
jgi:hypothetical protein